MKTFAIAQGEPPSVSLWCKSLGFADDGSEKFYVINGGWNGHYINGTVYVLGKHTFEAPGEVVWRGNAPFGEHEYNDAIEWITKQIT
jgi:hypothetical protein